MAWGISYVDNSLQVFDRKLGMNMRNRDLSGVMAGVGRGRVVEGFRYDIVPSFRISVLGDALLFEFSTMEGGCFVQGVIKRTKVQMKFPGSLLFFSLTFYYMASNLGLGCFNSESYRPETVAVDKVKTFVGNKQFRLLLQFRNM